MAEFTQAQKIATATYGGGDYHERWSTMEEVEAAEKKGEIGDTLFLFIMRELSEAGGLEEAAHMMDRASEQLSDLFVELDSAEPEDEDEGGDREDD